MPRFKRSRDSVTPSSISSQQIDTALLNPRQQDALFSRLCSKFSNDKHLQAVCFFGILLLVLTVISTVTYYLNHPQVELNADTPTYLYVVARIQQLPYHLVDNGRLPGYPLLIVFTYALAGKGNLMAVSIVQAFLFVLATLEMYLIALFVLRRTWLAFLIGVLIGTNLVLLSYVKPIMSEGLALWLLTTLTLAIAYFIRTLRIQALWLVAACMLSLTLTRPEWIYLPFLLFSYLLLVAIRRGKGQLRFGHFLVPLALIYIVIGAYIGVNAVVNHYPGLTAVENYNLLGKVLQYNMQDEVSAQDKVTSQALDRCIAHIDRDPHHVLACIPSLRRDNALPAGAYAQAIILHHPVEFLLKSIPLFFSSLIAYYDTSQVSIAGPFHDPLTWLKSIHRALYSWNVCFPACILIWLLLLCRRQTSAQPAALIMGAVVLLVLYGLIITTLGGYRADDYMRFHIVFDPLLILVVWGSILLAASFIVKQSSCFLAHVTSALSTFR